MSALAMKLVLVGVLFQLVLPVSGVANDKHVIGNLEKEKRANTGASPIDRVVVLIQALKDQIEVDHNKEQKSYDKFACWCEATFKRKIADIAAGKEFIVKAEARMLELSGEIATHKAEIQDLNKQIAANKDSQREATEVRDKEFADYKEERTESEQCIGALEAAINVLTPAGTGKGKFLETLQEAKLISVAGDVNRVLQKSRDLHSTSEQDLEVVRHFIEHPQDFMRGKQPVQGLLQTKNNPFGDYAPQSTQIQGILKGMYDGFTSDLEKDNAEESNKQKNYEEFIAIKKAELATLEKTLSTHELALAAKTKEYDETKTDRDNAKVQLEEDEAFFAATKKNCQDKAIQWGDRTRMRTEEINGVIKAIEILTSDEAKEVFEKSATTFLQVGSSSVALHTTGRSRAMAAKTRAYSQLKGLAAKYQSFGLARIAAEVKTGGHFDKVQMLIQQMIDMLRVEEQEDIDHRDRCENAENKNGNDMDDTKARLSKNKKNIADTKQAIKDRKAEKAALELDIIATKKAKKDLLDMRNEEETEFKESVKHDTDAIDIIEKAIVAISAFYKNHDLALSLTQKRATPEYTLDNNTAPELEWGDDKYRSGESGGVVAILRMLIEDTENEMKEAKKADAAAQEEYLQDKAALDRTQNAQERSLVSVEQEIADLQAHLSDLEATRTDLKDQKSGLQNEDGNLVKDCTWVKTHFQSRRDARKLELEGLQSAKAILAGVDAGDWNSVALGGR